MSTSLIQLDQIAIGQVHIVRRLSDHADHADRVQALEEIGFIPGEQVMLMARGIPGGDPLVVRVGLSTFALRRAEAAAILVTLPVLGDAV